MNKPLTASRYRVKRWVKGYTVLYGGHQNYLWSFSTPKPAQTSCATCHYLCPDQTPSGCLWLQVTPTASQFMMLMCSILPVCGFGERAQTLYIGVQKHQTENTREIVDWPTRDNVFF